MPHNQAYTEAEKKIEAARLSGATVLDLSTEYNAKDEEKLTELPDSIRQLTQLQWLNLSNNQLTTLSESLLELTQLQSLNLYSNQLTTLPESLSQLTQLQTLNLSINQLVTLPESLSQLTQLQTLDLYSNQLTTLPESLGKLTQLRKLHLRYNKLNKLPKSLEKLAYLQELDIGYNNFTELPNVIRTFQKLNDLNIGKNKINPIPEWIGELVSLESLGLYGNELNSLPDSLSRLVNLRDIWFGIPGDGNPIEQLPNYLLFFRKLEFLGAPNCKLTSLPEWIGNLTLLNHLSLANNSIHEIPGSIAGLKNLSALSIKNNQIVDLPPRLAQLEHLVSFELDDNPLNPALQSAYDQGLDAVKAYLRSLEQNAEPLYEAKLVLVGEGNVGKTTLLKALKGSKGQEAPKQGETTTHGVEIDIHALRLRHPAKDEVEIQLNAWDFGGQEVYRVMHQFFFSRRSLYLLSWEPRRGVQQCQVEDWLNMIRLRVGDEARVIIISTYSKSGEHIARIDKPVFKQQYGEMIVGFYEVDSLVLDEATGEMTGIAELKQVIAQESAKLQQMGMLFNNDWKAARDELLACPEPRISYTVFGETCAAHGLNQIDTDTLAHLMHDLGYIVHYSEDEKLRDDVVLKPQWLTKAIGFVLEDRATQESEGILQDNRLSQVWYDHPFKNEPRYEAPLYPFFLRLMEKYDVSYRLPEERRASLVAQHVPQVRPVLPWLPEQEPPDGLRRIAMICAMEEDPPGLVPWMIVRTHDYAAEQNQHRLHWQKGMFLSHAPHGEAMLEKRGREFHVYAQATYPEYFMNVLQETLHKLIKDNWPGMEGRYRFAVPCPELIEGQSCKGRFNIHALRQFWAEGDSTVRCQECSKRQPIVELLFGFEERSVDTQLREINEKLDGQESRIANYFMALMSAIADEAKHGPRLFTLYSQHAESLNQLFSRPITVQLWCEAEGCQHPVIENGKGFYRIKQPHEWVTQLAPYANFALKLLAIVAPIAAPAINTFFGPKTTETWKIADQLSLSSAIIGKIPATIEMSGHGLPGGNLLNEAERSGMLALHRFLAETDPTQEKLGLHRVPTYTGDYRWLCRQHYDAWQPKIPDVIAPSE